MGRFYSIPRGELLGMRLGEFFAWMEAMVTLKREEMLEAINTGVIIGQRGVDDKAYRQITRELRKPLKSLKKRLSKEEFQKHKAAVEQINNLFAEVMGRG